MKANNMAALREALENSNGLLEELAAIGEWGESAREQIAENNAALAEPARNCDRPECRDIRAAMTVYRRECCGDGPLYPRKEGAMSEAEWLLAPAEGRES